MNEKYNGGSGGMKNICMIAYTHFATDPRVKREAEALAEDNRVDVISLRDARNPVDNTAAIQFHPVNIRRYRAARQFGYLISYFVFFIKVFLKLNDLDKQRRYDIVYFHTMPDFIVFAGILQKLKGRKIVLDIHDLFPELYAIKFGVDTNSLLYRILVHLERWCSRFADTVISVHHPHQQRLIKRKVVCPRVIMNIPDDSIFNPGKRRDPEKFKFVFHGTISQRLGMDMLLDAAERIQHDMPDRNIYFRVFGVGEYAAAFRAKIGLRGLTAVIRFEERFFPIARIPELIGDAFAGIVPYESNIVHDYSLSVKMLEYIGMQIPVLTADLPSTRYYFGDDALIYYPSGNVDILYNKIRWMVENPDATAEMADHAYGVLSGRFNWSSEKDKLKTLVTG